MEKAAEEREFVDGAGHRWTVRYTDGGVRGMITMHQIVFEAQDGEIAGEERYLIVHPGYLERADDHKLETALSQAQRVDPPV
ncbi:MAG: hypothetical protein GWM90_00230 [Gemmatimonadetes bacterium]|nr:hypothetical protein [Gemmatimonadota bacterium]NIQ51953.1 hypothetical protein [Gemmatimonadota bacterium]NIU72056.1 hypothetical protein [Gammaproteobacteria bacterium]NIX42616.1 hypothetical protein [Gemmatimonadota bacterium]